VESLVHAEWSDRPFVGRGLFEEAHPAEVKREPILHPMLQQDYHRKEQRQLPE
jgi:hypothetical protein